MQTVHQFTIIFRLSPITLCYMGLELRIVNGMQRKTPHLFI